MESIGFSIESNVHAWRLDLQEVSASNDLLYSSTVAIERSVWSHEEILNNYSKIYGQL
jgi:hypothetical protein